MSAFLALMKDCAVPHKSSSFTTTMVNAIFMRCTVDRDPSDGSPLAVGPNQSHARDLSVAGFAEALVRVAHGRFRQFAKPLSWRLRRLLVSYIAPNAEQSGADAFRSVLRNMNVREVLRQYERPLGSAFRKFAGSSRRGVEKREALGESMNATGG